MRSLLSIQKRLVFKPPVSRSFLAPINQSVSLSKSQLYYVPNHFTRNHATQSCTSRSDNNYKIITTVPKLSQLLIPVLSNDNSSEDILVKHGYIKQVSSGIYHLLPLGQMVLRNIETIIRKYMVAVGGAELALSTFSNPKLWEQTGRINNAELFQLNDESAAVDSSSQTNSKPNWILAPTHEEEITALVASSISSSYRKLPLRLFQITRKYRKEKRPRGGLLRGKEFLMKDMYSFDATKEEALQAYEDFQWAYNKIFSELKVPFVVAEADTGSIGGTLSHEYHYLADIGEDEVATCTECKYTANVEKAVARPPETEEEIVNKEDIEKAKEQPEAKVEYYLSDDKETLVAAYYPASRVFNPLHLALELPEDVLPSDLETCVKGESALETFVSNAKENNDPELLMRRVIRVMDSRINKFTPLPEFPFKLNRSTTTTLVDVPIVMAQNGDLCPSCESPSLKVSKAIEVGHTFYLGTKYSEPLKALIYPQTESKGKSTQLVPIEMGCYGIGVSRVLASIAYINSDVDGLSWPANIAPYHAVIVSKDPKNVGAKIVSSLREEGGINAVLDDTFTESKGFGLALRNARSLGFPATIVVGNNFEKTGKVEIQPRNMTVAELKNARLEGKSHHLEATLEELPSKLKNLLEI